ncbi:MAG: pilus assembly protein PilP [Syntrophobacterales bacterium]|jgi:Tfp pilus assembly protein PilP|nr:pilus assembly protein PilP [Syntrophobacterales bacterium]
MLKPIYKPRKTLTSSYLAVLIAAMMCLAIMAFPVWAEEEGLPPVDPPAVQTGSAPPMVTPPGSLGSKDPFKPFVDTGEAKKQKAKAIPISPLQRQDLSMFKVVGISGSDREGWRAIVEDGEKKFYIIKEGTLIGLDEGRVSQIRSDRVVVAVKDPDAKGKINHITMKLYKDIEEAP